MEATTQAVALYINYNDDGTIVRGLGFEHYATGYDPARMGALRVDSNSVTVEDNTFAYNALAGMAAFDPNCTIEGNTFAFNGESGLQANAINRSLLEGNAFAYNNQRHFAVDWNAAGVKISHSSNVTVKDNLSDSNLSDGFWFDGRCSGTTIVGNESRNDSDNGIFYEISSNAIIASNLVVDSPLTGITVSGSSNVEVYNNTLAGNYQDIRVQDDSRVPNMSNVIIGNNILSNGASNSTEMVQIVDITSSPKTAKQMNIAGHDHHLLISRSGRRIRIHGIGIKIVIDGAINERALRRFRVHQGKTEIIISS